MRGSVGLIIIGAFLGWTLWRWLIKRDLKQHMQAFYVYLFFAGIWGLIYLAIYIYTRK